MSEDEKRTLAVYIYDEATHDRLAVFPEPLRTRVLDEMARAARTERLRIRTLVRELRAEDEGKRERERSSGSTGGTMHVYYRARVEALDEVLRATRAPSKNKIK